MNIQIFGKNKCFDTKKAQRWFKERGIKFQMIDLAQKGMSKGELDSVLRAVGGLDALIDEKSRGYASLAYLAYDEDRKEKLLEDGTLMKTPVVRNGRQATVGYCPEVWEKWEWVPASFSSLPSAEGKPSAVWRRRQKGDKTPIWFLIPLLTPPNLPLRRHIGDVRRNGGRGLGSGRHFAHGWL